MLKALAQRRDFGIAAVAGGLVGAGVATYPVGGLALLMPAALLVFFATVHSWPRWARRIARGVILAATLVWPITWIGVGLLLTPLMIPLLLWAVSPQRRMT